MNLPVVVRAPSATDTAAPSGNLPWKAYGSALALLIAGDRLLLDFPPGTSLVLFLLLVALCMPVANDWSVSSASRRLLGVPILLAALLPLVETVNPLTVMTGLGGFGRFAVVGGGGNGSLWQKSGLILRLLFSGPVRLPRALSTAVRRIGEQRPKTAGLVHWLLPVCFGLVFVVLLQSANPIIERWIERADLLLLRCSSTLASGE